MSEFQIPNETIQLPSKGYVYPESSLLSKGEIEMRYMRTVEEDILTNINFIKQGVALDKLLKSLVVSPINIDDLIIGDKNALLFAARIMGYGKEYPIKYANSQTGNIEEYIVDLTELKDKPLDTSLTEKGKNEFKYKLPKSDKEITFKLLTGKDEKDIDIEVKNLKKINPEGSYESSTRLKYMITSVEGNRETSVIRSFVDNMLAMDSRALRSYYNSISPDIDTTINIEKNGYVQEGVVIPLDTTFFWPDL